MALQMSPPKSFFYLVNKSILQIKFSRQLSNICNWTGQNFKSQFFRNNGCRISFTLLASMLSHVSHIVIMRSKVKMFWVHTFPIMTFMQHIHPWWKVSLENKPRISMRISDASLYGRMMRSAETAVSVNKCCSRPIPTGLSFLNILKESFSHKWLLCKNMEAVN